jgi:hypothetical protein
MSLRLPAKDLSPAGLKHAAQSLAQFAFPVVAGVLLLFTDILIKS